MCRTPNTYVTADRKKKHKQSLDMTAGNYEKKEKTCEICLDLSEKTIKGGVLYLVFSS